VLSPHWLRLDVNRDAPSDVGSNLRPDFRANARPKTRSITTNLVFRLPTDSPRTIPFAHPEHARAAPQIT
jgi:hypothetical protein